MRNIFFAIVFVGVFGVLGCSKKNDSDDRQSEVVHVFDAPAIPDFKYKISSPQDMELVNSFPVERSESKTFNFDPPLQSDDVFVHKVEWNPSGLSVYVSPVGSSSLIAVKNTRECEDGDLAKLGKLVLMLSLNSSVGCFKYSSSYSYSSLSYSGSKYPIYGYDSEDFKKNINGQTVLQFKGVPFSALSGFELDGVGWSSKSISVGLSEEDRLNAIRVRELIRKKSDSMSINALVELLNRNGGNPEISGFIVKELADRTGGSMNVEALGTIVRGVSDGVVRSNPEIKKIAFEYMDSLYAVAVRPSNDPEKMAGFLLAYISSVEDGLYEKAFMDGVKIESLKIDGFVRSVDSKSFFERIFSRIDSGKTDDEQKEFFVRSYANEMRRVGKDGNPVLAAMMLAAVSDTKSVSGLQAVFDIQRDEDMKKFLKGQFSMLRQSNDKSAERVVGAVRALSVSVDENMNKIAQGLTHVSSAMSREESRGEERERNMRMAVDMAMAEKNLGLRR